jgi:hypothetical protein
MIFQLYRDGQFYCWKEPEKTTDLQQITDKLDHAHYRRVYHYHWVDAYAGELLVPEGITHPVVSTSELVY